MLNSDKANAIRKVLESSREELLEFLTELASCESYSEDLPALARALDLLQRKWESLGFKVRRIRGCVSGGAILAVPARRDRNKPVQLMLGHCDTVWPHGTLAEMPIEYRDTKLHGPGIFDMKAGLTQMIFAIKAIQKLGFDTDVTPVVLINSDEEIGSGESTPWIGRVARACNRALVLEPPLAGKLKTSRKGIGRFEIVVHGKSAHAGLDPKKGASAISEMSHVIRKLTAMIDYDRGITVNVGTIEGGTSPNVVAAECRARVDVRAVTNADAEEVTRNIREMTAEDPDVTLEINGGFTRPPMERTDRNTRLWNQAQSAAELLGMKIEDAFVGGGSDGNTTSQYTATLDGLGTSGDGAHASHEHIDASEIVERTALLAMLLLAPPTEH